MNKPLILVVEDDRSVNNLITTILKTHDYRYLPALNGAEAVLEASSHNPDIVLLDLGLPDTDGVDIIKKIRTWSNMPIIVISARSEDTDKILGLNTGADDYITKPFNPVEVTARVRSQLRRYMQLGSRAAAPARYVIGGVELDDSSKEVTLDGEPISLTPIEYDILKLLMESPGKVYSPKEIYRQVWKEAPLGSDNTVAVHIRHLREKIEINPADPRYLKVVWGQGYKMEKGAKR